MITKDDLKGVYLKDLELMEEIKNNYDFNSLSIKKLGECYDFRDSRNLEIVTIAYYTLYTLAFGGYGRYSEDSCKRKLEEIKKFDTSAISIISFILSTWSVEVKGEICLPFYLKDMIALIEYKGYDSKKVLETTIEGYKNRRLGGF